MDKTCKFLRVSSVIFKVLAWVAIGIGISSAMNIFLGATATQAAKVTTGIIFILGGVFYFFVLFTASKILTLLLDIHTKLDKS